MKLENSAAVLGKLALDQGKVCTTAESCTAGLVSAAITDIAGSSVWFDRGFVTYSDQAKTEMLGVEPQTLSDNGAVSEEVAREMVRGAIKNSGAQLSVAITGIAGPEGGSLNKPVGTVCFAWAFDDQELLTNSQQKVWSETRYFNGNRQQIRKLAVDRALVGLIALLNGTIEKFVRR